MKRRPRSSSNAQLAVMAIATMAVLAGCAATPAADREEIALPGAVAAPLAEQKYGIRVHALRLSAHGYLLDFRYRVTDAGKAASLLDPKRKVHLLDPARSARLGVPESPVIGAMRQTARNYVLYTDRDYFILFVNPGRAVQRGEVLHLAVDGEKLIDLTVQ